MSTLTDYIRYTEPNRRNTRILIQGRPVTIDIDKLYKEESLKSKETSSRILNVEERS